MAKGQGIVTIEKMPLKKIKLNKNSRLNVDPDELEGLMQSIKTTGLLQPIGVIKNGTGYEICYGNRRFMACSKLGMTSMPVIVHERKSESDVDIKNLTENVQRRNISLTEVGRYIGLLEKEGLSQAECAVRLGVSISYVKAAVDAFGAVPKEFREAIDVRLGNKGGLARHTPGKISISTARSIIGAEKTGVITKAQAKKLYKAAKSSTKFNAGNIGAYIRTISSGEKDFLNKTPKSVRIAVTFAISEDHKNELEKKFITDGPFSSMNALCIAILKGEKAVQMKIEKRRQNAV